MGSYWACTSTRTPRVTASEVNIWINHERFARSRATGSTWPVSQMREREGDHQRERLDLSSLPPGCDGPPVSPLPAPTRCGMRRVRNDRHYRLTRPTMGLRPARRLEDTKTRSYFS